MSLNVVISGATGFIGRNLLQKLEGETDYNLIALSRRVDPQWDRTKKGRVEWRRCNGFSLIDTDRATEGADVLIYLIHSMLPTAKLSQGRFEDFDLIVADNFARSCQHNHVKQIIYLSGIVPDEKLSLHLESRLEVEDALRAYGNSLTTLRASLVVGANGSSFRILEKLVERLPVMLLPAWTASKCQPVQLDYLLENIKACIGNDNDKNKTYDVGGDEIVTYAEMLSLTAKVMNKSPIFVNFPYFSPGLSKLWVSKITSSSKNLVYPLIESLKHTMVVDPAKRIDRGEVEKVSLEKSLSMALKKEPIEKGFASRETVNYATIDMRSLINVTSVQRLPKVAGKKAEWIAYEYIRWLPKFLRPFVQIKSQAKQVRFYLFGFIFLLELTLSPERSDEHRQLLYVTGGLLNKDTKLNGRLEFRQLDHLNCMIVALHDFRPSLPWFVYKYTQALIHLFVMKSFGRYLARVKV